MFGLSPAFHDDRPRTESVTVYQASMVGATLVGLGLACLILAIAQAPRVAAADSSVLLVGLPLLVASFLGITLGYANLHTRITIGGGRLDIVAPSWRGLPVPPIQYLSVALDEVRSIRWRTERLGIGLPGLRVPVEVHVIETGRGHIVLAGFYQGDLDTALTEIVARTGCGRAEDADVTVSLWRMLMHGEVPFSDRQAPTRGARWSGRT